MGSPSLASKLKLKPGQKAVVINPPEGYLKTLASAVAEARLSDPLDDRYDWIQVFVRNKAELEAWVPRVLPALRQASLLWISFPKGSSRIQTDLTRDTGWDSLQQADLKWINLVSVDDIWSAFCLRPYRPGEAHQSFR